MDISFPHNSYQSNPNDSIARVSIENGQTVVEALSSVKGIKNFTSTAKDTNNLIVRLSWNSQTNTHEIGYQDNDAVKSLLGRGKNIVLRHADGTETTLNTNQVSLRVLSAAETTNMLQRMFQGIRKEKEDRENGVPTHYNRPEISSGDIKDAAQGVKGEQKKAPPAIIDGMVRGILRQMRETDKVRKEKEAERIEEEKDLKQSVIKRQEQNRELVNNDIAMQEGLPPNPKQAKKNG